MLVGKHVERLCASVSGKGTLRGSVLHVDISILCNC